MSCQIILRAAQTFKTGAVNLGQTSVLESSAVVEDHACERFSGAKDDGHAVAIEASGNELGIRWISGRGEERV